MAKDRDIRRLLEGKPSDDAKSRFDDEMEDYDKIAEHAARWKTPSSKSKQKALEELKDRIKSGEAAGGKQSKVKPLHVGRLAIAAAVALLVASTISIYFFKSLTVNANFGEQPIVNLTDNVKVQLNADSKLSYSRFALLTSGPIKLNGEAFFEVIPGTDFSVFTSKAKITVYGTKFNVFARENKLRVACQEGSVQVTIPEKSSVLLNEGESTELVNSDLLKEPGKTNDRKTASWRNGEFFYSETALTEVFEEIERQFRVKIISENMEERLYTGYFNSKDLNEALTLVCVPMGLNFQIEQERVLIN